MDRQDIDALLIGALYGELTPAEEARLATHLESHPGDRGALDDLKVARQAVLDSRIFAVQLEPPQAVSALLLQEAHRRAPKKVVAADEAKDGWFARFARSFMAHPAMAAAAMLVLVMGGAGIVWMKKGDQFASSEYSQAPAARDQAEATPVTATTTPTPEPVLPEGNAAVAAGSAYNADLYNDGKPLDGADDGKAAEQRAQLDRGTNKQAEERSRDDLSKAKRPSAIEVTTERAPKDFESAKGKSDSAADDLVTADKVAPKPQRKATTSATGTGGGGSANGPAFGGVVAGPAPGRAADSASFDLSGGETANAVSGAGYSQPPSGGGAGAAAPAKKPATAAPVTTPTAPKTGGAKVATDSKSAPAKTVTKTAKPAPPPPAKPAEPPASIAAAPPAADPSPAPAPAKESATKNEAKKDESSTLLAWAKAEHQRAVGLAKGGNCSAAAKIALTVSNRASSYYSQYMATDRSLKACAQYINAERDKEAERTQKARASKRVNADEPAPYESTK